MDVVLCTTLLLCLWLLTNVCSKTEVRVVVPPVVKRGSTITLVCLHNVTSNNLYSVKWYRGNYEFYRFAPRNRPPTTVFPLIGLEVDMHGSNGRQVAVRILETRISGRFTCEVSAEEPTFSTDSDSALLSVIDVGLRRPLLKPASSVHIAGTPLEVNCSAQPTEPPPILVFYIDNRKVNDKWVTELEPGLSFLKTQELSMPEGRHWVSCEASVPGVYHLASASIQILEKQLLSNTIDNGGIAPSYSVINKIMLCILLVYFKYYKTFYSDING